MLGGGNPYRREQAYARGAQAAIALAEARRKQEESIAKETALRGLENSSDPNERNIATYFRAGIDPREYTGSRKDLQGIGWGDEARAAIPANLQGMELVNALNLVRDAKPHALTQIQDHTVFNPMLLPGSQPMATNDIGRAMMATESSKQAENYAQAGAANALARHRDAVGVTPEGIDGLLAQANDMSANGVPQETIDTWLTLQMTGRGVKVSAPPKHSPLTGPELSAYFGDDPGAARSFLVWQDKNGSGDDRADLRKFFAQQEAAAAAAPKPVPQAAPSLMDRLSAAVGIGKSEAHGVDPAKQKRGTDAATPQTQADYDALPSGALYRDPDDGKLRRKR